MKIDPHVHSKHSTRPSQWILQKLGCPESFTEPEKIYRLAKAQGMDMVTISDHNTIDGALEIAHLPDAFVSVEITSYFPDDRCKVHVLALDITEAQFADIQKCRENLYDLVPFLKSQGIAHVCAHPLYSVNDRHSTDHFEQLLLLFKTLELNGARDATANEVLRMLIQTLTREDMERLADKHGIEPDYPDPWAKGLTAGSDDHGGLNIARMHTMAPGAKTLDEFLDAVRQGRTRPLGECALPETMAHNLYAIAYQFYKNKFGLERYVNKDIFLRFVDRFLSGEAPKSAGVIDRFQAYWSTRRYLSRRQTSNSVQDVCRREAARLILDDKKLSSIARSSTKLPDNKGRVWSRFVNNASNKVLKYFADAILGHVAGGNVFDVFQTVGSAGALYTFLAPYFVSTTIYAQDQRFSAEVSRALGKNPDNGKIKVGHYTDTFFEVNGVARTLQRSVALARRTGRDLTMVTCKPHEGVLDMEGVKNFAPIGVFDLPEYPEMKIFYPPVLEMIQHAFEARFTHIHSATPGPIGLAALLVARLFKLPIHGTYHTQIPQYAQKLTGDDGLEDLTWRYTLWYYGQMDSVYAPSQATADELIDRGLDQEKILVYPRGVDTTLFHPTKRNGFLKRYGVTGGFTILYVGRVSKEKNLDLLAEAYQRFSRSHPQSTLVVVGHGPYEDGLRAKLRGARCVFTGVLEGEDLAQAYASSDLFVFPSKTDTFGNVVLEAQASGLPVIVSNQGGPRENMTPDETGLVVSGDSVDELCAAMNTLASNPARMLDMGENARKKMETQTFEAAFAQTWDLYRHAV